MSPFLIPISKFILILIVIFINMAPILIQTQTQISIIDYETLVDFDVEVISTINFDDVKLIKQKDDTITVRFGVSISDGLQPQVIYALNYFSFGGNSEYFFDEFRSAPLN